MPEQLRIPGSLDFKDSSIGPSQLAYYRAVMAEQRAAVEVDASGVVDVVAIDANVALASLARRSNEVAAAAE